MKPRSRSLVRRLTAGVMLVSLLGFVAQLLVMGIWLRPLAEDVGTATTEQARQVRTALQSVAPADRDALAQRLSSPSLRITRIPPPSSAGQEITSFPNAQDQKKQLQADGIGLRIEERPGHRIALIFSLPVDDQRWWMVRTATGPGTAVFSTLVVWLVVLGLATWGGLWYSVQQIAGPLRTLAADIARQRDLPECLPVRPGYAAELQALVEAFNKLALQVADAAQARQALLAGVSHDLRTPLARLLLRAETQCEPEVAEAFSADLQALQRIVAQFLAYVQGDAGGLKGEPRPLVQVVEQFIAASALAGSMLQASLDPVALPVPDLVVQRLLMNLVDNAFAHGGAPVRVALADEAHHVALTVYDSGAGMSPQEFEHASKPFVRLSHARSQLGHCGLGLSIVAQLVRQLNADCHVTSGADGAFGIRVRIPKS